MISSILSDKILFKLSQVKNRLKQIKPLKNAVNQIIDLAYLAIQEGYYYKNGIWKNKSPSEEVVYISEDANWVIRWIGDRVVAELKSYPGQENHRASLG